VESVFFYAWILKTYATGNERTAGLQVTKLLLRRAALEINNLSLANSVMAGFSDLETMVSDAGQVTLSQVYAAELWRRRDAGDGAM
jgi:hypothetical protein